MAMAGIYGYTGFGGFGGFGMNAPSLGGFAGFNQPAFSPLQANAQNSPMQMYQMTQILQMLMGALQQLSQGYAQMMGGGQAVNRVGQAGGAGGAGDSGAAGGTGAAGGAGGAGGTGRAGAAGGAGGGYGSGGGGGVGTQPPATRPPGVSDPGFAAWAADPKSVGSAERTRISQLDDKQRAILHVWGMQTGSSGKNDGGVIFNILNSPQDFKPEEVAFAREAYNYDMQHYGGVTGKGIDQAFFGLYKDMTGEDVSQRYNNRPLTFAQGPVDMNNRVTGNNGLSQFDNAVIRMWGHDRLDNGQNDGSIVQFSLQNAQSMDADLVGKQRGNIEALLAADEADGGRDGSALARAFQDSMDRIYLGGPGANVDKTLAESGINRTTVGSVLDRIKDTPFPGIPPGIDITNTANIGKCPFFKGGMGQVKINN